MNKKEIIESLHLPKRVLITGGMPNGNKPLHLGHIGSIFIWADFYARFMRSVLGKENVIFISGTDGFGSSTEEKYRKLKEAGKTDLTLEDYINNFHLNQKKTLEDYDISINLFSASCLGDGFNFHKQTSSDVFTTLLNKGLIEKKQSKQFYDTKLNVVLNGRQVEGKCPIDGCTSEVGYADECSLGHQYSPTELIDPISTLSKTTPVFKDITNYYLNLDNFREDLYGHLNNVEKNDYTRKFLVRELKDYLAEPKLFINKEIYDENETLVNSLHFKEKTFDEKRNRMILTFSKVNERDIACETLNEKGIHYSGNKALAPLRISGNSKWGVPLPIIESEPETKDLTFYVWPESLWAPISFTKQYLNNIQSKQNWKDWWCSNDSKIVQFIGEDNIYFYSLAETAIFLGLQEHKSINSSANDLQIPTIVANKHLLIDNMKASSSGSNAAPTANDLLKYYTPDQLRCHFLSQNLNTVGVNFKSKVITPQNFENCGDPVVAQGNNLTNYFNRIIRSVFYTLQTYFNGNMPENDTNSSVLEKCDKTLNEFIEKFRNLKFSEIMPILENYFKDVNLNWASNSKTEDKVILAQLITDTIHYIKTALLMIQFYSPKGSELVIKYMNADEKIIDWDNANKTFKDIYPNINKFIEIPPKFDFFKKHESQLK